MPLDRRIEKRVPMAVSVYHVTAAGALFVKSAVKVSPSRHFAYVLT
jgi:hypothetical protein